MAEIKFYDGHTGVLLIAPHAVEKEPMDDKGTAALVRKIQDTMSIWTDTARLEPILRKHWN